MAIEDQVHQSYLVDWVFQRIARIISVSVVGGFVVSLLTAGSSASLATGIEVGAATWPIWALLTIRLSSSPRMFTDLSDKPEQKPKASSFWPF